MYVQKKNEPLGNGRSTVVSIRSVPRLLVSLTGGAGGLSSSLDIFFSKYRFFSFSCLALLQLLAINVGSDYATLGYDFEFGNNIYSMFVGVFSSIILCVCIHL